MSKKITSKFFRVAVEGATTDGRQIERAWIAQMAKNFDPIKYGARVWLEHIRGTLPDSVFRAYGDVLALRAEELTLDGESRLALYAQIEPTADLIKMTKGRQKIYTSIEIDDKFANSGEAYLVGLAVTDSPASLGTEMLSFAAKNPTANPLAARKHSPNTLFSEATEVCLEFDETETDSQSLAQRVKEILGRFNAKKSGDEARFTDLTEAIESLLTHVGSQDQQITAANDRIAKLETGISSVSGDFNKLRSELESQSQQPERPRSSGASGLQQTDC